MAALTLGLSAASNIVDVAVDFMDEYSSVFSELAK